jgi:NhaP-type Na+/H+ or K+/H+ antiporter
MTLIAIFIALVFFYCLISRWLSRTIVTGPILFTAGGMLLTVFMLQLHALLPGREVFLQVAELGLVLLLFTDASRTDLKVLKNIRNLPTRLLSTGMLLTILLGALGALVVFRHLSIWEAGILAAILAPTDAGLGQIIVNSPRVPLRIRQALNVEAGLNDGLSVPFLLFFLALVQAGSLGEEASLTQFVGEQLGYGVLVGAGIGLTGGWLLNLARRRELMTKSLEQLGVVALPLFCILASKATDASMFIAAFVAGLAVQFEFKEASHGSIEFAEDWGEVVNLSVFFLFGMIVARDWQDFTVAHVLYAVLSLTVVRMLPVALALIGTGLNRATVLFMGWFGPRGLASIVLGLVYLAHETHSPGEPTIRLAVMVTVLLSIFAHGLSALPGTHLYAAKIATLDASAPERQSA